jgi:hypothetical protein
MWQRVFNFLLKFDHFYQKKEYCHKIFLFHFSHFNENWHQKNIALSMTVTLKLLSLCYQLAF